MSGPDDLLQRAHAYLGDARDPNLEVSSRAEALDAARASLRDARRAGASPSHLLPIFDSICRTSTSDKAYEIRLIVPQVVEDMCIRELRAFVKVATPYLQQTLMDSHFLVIKRAVRALTTLFRKLIGLVVSVGVGTSETQFPEQLLTTWLQMHHKAASFINSQDEGLRNAATKFIETVVLAFSYSGGTGSAEHFTLDYILTKGATNPLLNDQILENEGVQGVKAVAHLIHSALQGTLVTKHPNGSFTRGLPPTSFMTAVTVLSNLVRRRKKLLGHTLPPLLRAVACVTGSTMPPSQAFLLLTPSQQKSITIVLRYSLQALHAYQHTRVDRAGEDVNRATKDLLVFEKEQERMRRERIARMQQQRNAIPEAPPRLLVHRTQPAMPLPDMKPPLPMPPPQLSMKRPRSLDHGPPWPRLPAKEAIAVSQNLLRQMPPKEVVNFIMTRILLNIPPADTIPGVFTPRKRAPNGLQSDANLPVQKKQKRSRFNNRENSASVASTSAPKKVVPVQRKAPPVVPARLSPAAIEKLVVSCCQRILKRESQAIASGSGPLRIQLLARLLSTISMTESEIASNFCKEALSTIATNIENNISLAIAWLHSLVLMEKFPSQDTASIQETIQKSEDQPVNTTEEKANAETTETSHPNGQVVEQNNEKTDPMIVDATSTGEQPCNEDNERKSEKNDKTKQISDSEKDTTLVTKADEPNGINSNGHSSETLNDQEKHEKNTEEEFIVEEENQDVIAGPIYEKILTKLLDSLVENTDISHDTFGKLFTEAPILPTSTFQFIKKLCLNPSQSKLGLRILHAIVEERPGRDRQTCLLQLFGFTSHEDEVVRGQTIRLLTNCIFVESSEEVKTTIQEHAKESLRNAVERVSTPSKPEELKALELQSVLLTALSTQKHELVKYMAESYVTASPDAKRVILMRTGDLAAHVGMKSLPLLHLIEGKMISTELTTEEEESKTDHLEDLALGVLKALLKKYGKPTKEIVKAAMTRFEMNKNTEFLIAVLPGLVREALLQNLEAIVIAAVNAESESGNDTGNETSDQDNITKTHRMKDVIGKVMGEHPPALSPAEFLVELHKIPASDAANIAIRACFEMKGIYKQEVIAQAIEQLMEITSTPDLFMRTVHLTREFYPEREKYLTETVMLRLLDRKVWLNSSIWEGFLSYCANIREKSLRLLLKLPPPQLREALLKQAVLKSVSEEFLANAKVKKKPLKLRQAVKAVTKKATT